MSYLNSIRQYIPQFIGLLLGFFFAYITVVTIWRIKPDIEETELDPFKSRFGKTALAGLAGSVVTDLVSNLMKSDEAAHPLILKWYLICFVISFFLVLFYFASRNAKLEADRAAIMFDSDRRIVDVVRRDTFLNLIRGKNQMRTQELVDEVGTYQEMIRSTCERLCETMKEMIRHAARDTAVDVRVSISVAISANAGGVTGRAETDAWPIAELEYVTRDEKSKDQRFEKTSIAWFAVMLGEPRWYLKGWKDSEDRFLLDKNGGWVPEEFAKILGPKFQGKVLFKDYWEEREPDYEAFLIIPIPRIRRYITPIHCGAIHVSFSDAEKFKEVFGIHIVEHSGFHTSTMLRFEEQPLVKELEAMSDSLVPLLRKYDPTKAKFHTKTRPA